jgi:hypothetical protein
MIGPTHMAGVGDPQSGDSQAADIATRVYFEGWVLALTFATQEEARAGRWGYAVACFLIGAFLQLVVIRWDWIRRNPRLATTARNVATDARWWVGTLILFLVFLAFSPYVEQARWPYSWLPTEGRARIQSLEDQLDAQRHDLVTAQQQITSLQTELQANRNTPPTAQASVAPEADLSPVDRATKLEIWNSVNDEHMSGFVNSYNDLDQALAGWRDRIKGNKSEFISKLEASKKELAMASARLEKLRGEYASYSDISSVIEQPYTAGTLKTIDELVDAVKALSDKLPADYEVIINPYMGNVRVETTHLQNWITDVKRMANLKITELSGRR